MKDRNGVEVQAGDAVKYSFNMMGIPTFTGTVIYENDEWLILHSDKVKVPLNDEIEYLEIIEKGEK